MEWKGEGVYIYTVQYIYTVHHHPISELVEAVLVTQLDLVSIRETILANTDAVEMAVPFLVQLCETVI